MQRRKFIQTTVLGTGSACFSAPKIFDGVNGEKYPKLKRHKIDKIERVKYEYHWPRHVGKNARRKAHGQFHKSEAFKLFTDQGAMGWALGSNKIEDQQLSQLQGRFVSELISPEKGMRQDLSPFVDLALHDLMGIILHKPVYKLLGAKGAKNTPVYSGMIYFDELEPEDNPAGVDNILETHFWDISN
jgi:D-galactarolactone cycloisomerase